jgi:hypothetical protein
MCLPIAVRRPDRVLAHGEHAGHEWMIVHNGSGHRCGYVKFEPGHPWHGKGMDDIDASVHGGITFAAPDMPCDKGGDDNGWWVGFDCAHSGDAADPTLPGAKEIYLTAFEGDVIRTTEYVQAECESLCEHASRTLFYTDALDHRTRNI